MTVARIQPLVVENIAFPNKIDINFEDYIEGHLTTEPEYQQIGAINENPTNDECCNDNKVWCDADSNDSPSDSMIICFAIQHISGN